MQTLGEMLSAAVSHAPDTVFLDDGSRRITYAEFDRLACRLATVLRDSGAKRATPVGMYLPSRVDLVVGYHACQKIGAVAMPISGMFRYPELSGVATRTGLPLLITDAAGAAVATQVRDSSDTLATVLDTSGSVPGLPSLPELTAAAPDAIDPVRCHPEDVATCFFTSGTTGAPKGIMQSHRGVYSTVRDMEVYNRFRWNSETLLATLPMFNNFGATCVMVQGVYNAGTVIVHERWDTERALEDIARHSVTYFAGTPTMITYLLQGYREGEHDLSSLRLAITGGAPVAPEMITACRDRLGLEVRQIYGSSEVCGYVAGDPVVGVRKHASTGPAFGSASLSVVDDEGRDLPTGEVGEVVIGGDTVGAGYWGDDELTARTFTERGWVSGDVGYLDEDGYLFLVDRKKDLIICGGNNIRPIEVEGVLFGHAAVALCAVVGVPDEVRGEIPVAAVVRSGGSDATADDLREFCAQHLAAYKVPRRVEFLTDLPVGPSGKILKRELRDRLTEDPQNAR